MDIELHYTGWKAASDDDMEGAGTQPFGRGPD